MDVREVQSSKALPAIEEMADLLFGIMDPDIEFPVGVAPDLASFGEAVIEISPGQIRLLFHVQAIGNQALGILMVDVKENPIEVGPGPWSKPAVPHRRPYGPAFRR